MFGQNPLRNLKDSAIFNDLIKTDVGKNIAARIIKLSNDIDLLPDIQKEKFASELGGKFVSILKRTEKEKVETSLLIYFVILVGIGKCFYGNTSLFY